MPVYLIANVKLMDNSWVPDYAAKVYDIVHKHGAKYLSRSSNITPVEGEAPNVDGIALLELPTIEAAQSMFEDQEYLPNREARRKETNSQIYSIDDTDLMESIPYLDQP